MATPKQLAINFPSIRTSLVNLVQAQLGIQCTVEERKAQTTMATPRPNLPYCTIKITNPAGKIGTDSAAITGTPAQPSSVWLFGGCRRMTVSFKCYAKTQEEAYDYMALLEGLLDTDPVQQSIRANGFAFWQSLGVIDITTQVNAGYEGRASLDAYFGVPSNLNIELCEMDTVPIAGEISFGENSADVNFTVLPEDS